jgi:hypothetical protein
VRDSVKKGSGEHEDKRAFCFMPRQGMRFVSEMKTFDLVICFQFLQLGMDERETQIGWKRPGNSPAPIPEKILTDSKSALPEREWFSEWVPPRLRPARLLVHSGKAWAEAGREREGNKDPRGCASYPRIAPLASRPTSPEQRWST